VSSNSIFDGNETGRDGRGNSSWKDFSSCCLGVLLADFLTRTSISDCSSPLDFDVEL